MATQVDKSTNETILKISKNTVLDVCPICSSANINKIDCPVIIILQGFFFPWCQNHLLCFLNYIRDYISRALFFSEFLWNCVNLQRMLCKGNDFIIYFCVSLPSKTPNYINLSQRGTNRNRILKRFSVIFANVQTFKQKAFWLMQLKSVRDINNLMFESSLDEHTADKKIILKRWSTIFWFLLVDYCLRNENVTEAWNDCWSERSYSDNWL